LAEALLAKETLALPEIVDILGPRPYPLKPSILEYIEELRDRKVEEAKESADKKESSETVVNEDKKKEEENK